MTQTLEKCPICESPERKSFEEQVLKGQLTKRDLADILSCRVDEIYEHMTKHVVKAEMQSLSDKRNVLLDILQKLNDSLVQIASSKNYGPVTTKQLVEVAREVRQTIMSFADLEGNLPKDQRITIQEYNDLRSLVITNSEKFCPTCKQLLIEGLEAAEKEQKNNVKPVIEIKP